MIFPCVIDIKKGEVKHIYLWGKKEIEVTPKLMDNSLPHISRGIAEYFNMETLNKARIVLLEPYLRKNASTPQIESKGIGKAIVWTKNKSHSGKSIFVVEKDEKGNFIREREVKLIYCRSKRKLKKLKCTEIEIPVGTKFEFIQKPRVFRGAPITFYAPVTNTKFLRPLKKGEVRYIKIDSRID